MNPLAAATSSRPRRVAGAKTTMAHESASIVASLPSGAVRLSVVVLTAHRRDVLSDCLTELEPQALRHNAQLIIGCNGDPATAHWLREHHPSVETVALPTMTLGAARNRLIDRCIGEILLFLDDDTHPSPDLLATLLKLADQHPEIAVFGGPNTAPPVQTRFVSAQDAVLRSAHTGPIRRRFRAGEANTWSLCLCNLAIRADAAPRFDEHVTAGEETELLHRLRRHGATLAAFNELAVTHHRRPTLASFARQMHKYGHGRAQAHPLVATAPLVLLAGCALGPRRLRILAALAYSTAVAATAVRTGRESRCFATAWWVTVIAPVMHSSYLAGLIGGGITALNNGTPPDTRVPK